MTIADLLELLKVEDNLDPETHPERQNNGIVVFLDQDPILERLVALWPNVPKCRFPDVSMSVPPDLPETHTLKWLWANLEPDPIPLWLGTAGLPDRPDNIRRCWAAIENKMVFPDGSRSTWANKFVTKRAWGAM